MVIVRQLGLVVDCEIFKSFIPTVLSYDNRKMFRKLDVRRKSIITLALS